MTENGTEDEECAVMTKKLMHIKFFVAIFLSKQSSSAMRDIYSIHCSAQPNWNIVNMIETTYGNA